MKHRLSLFIVSVALSFAGGCRTTALPVSTMPSLWSDRWVFGDNAARAWVYTTEGGIVQPERVLDLQYALGSKHDGDRQFYTAMSLLELPVDPHEALLAMLQSKVPERRAFSALVIGELGDKRFYPQLCVMAEDRTPLKNCPWNTLGETAQAALWKMHSESDLMDPGFSKLAAEWLKAARSIDTGYGE